MSDILCPICGNNLTHTNTHLFGDDDTWVCLNCGYAREWTNEEKGIWE